MISSAEQCSQPTEQSSDDIGMTIKEYYFNKQLDSQSVLLSAVYNLPCFYKVLGNRILTKPVTQFMHVRDSSKSKLNAQS